MFVEVLVPLIVFSFAFGVAYLFFNSRHRERMAMIERGVDANLFNRERSKTPFFNILLLNAGLLGMGIGIAVLLGSILQAQFGLEDDTAYPALIFLFGGMALFIGFRLTQKLDDKYKAKAESEKDITPE